LATIFYIFIDASLAYLAEMLRTQPTFSKIRACIQPLWKGGGDTLKSFVDTINLRGEILILKIYSFKALETVNVRDIVL